MPLLATPHRSGTSGLLTTVTRGVGLAVARPWLPAGEWLPGRLFRPGLEPATGLDWLDQPGPLDARARLGYAPILPVAGPRVTSLALRLELPDGGSGDLVLVGDVRLRARRRGESCGPGALLSPTTYDEAGRSISFAARPCGSETFELLCNVERGEWRLAADLRICRQPLDGDHAGPDPVANALPGLSVPGLRRRPAI